MNELELFKQIIDASHYGKCIIDNNKNILAANSAFERIFGKSVSNNIEELSVIFDDPVIKNLFSDTISKKYPNVGIKTSKDFGKEFSISISPIGELNYFLIEIIDSSTTTLSKENMDILFEHSPSFVAIIDPNLRVLRANRKFKELFGEIGTKALPELYKRKNSVPQYLMSEMCFKTATTQSGTQIVYPKDDRKVYLFTTAIPLNVVNGKVTKVITISHDITEINNIYDQMVELSDYFHTIFQKCSQGMIIISSKGKITGLNNAAKEAMNWSKSRKPGIIELSNLLEININD